MFNFIKLSFIHSFVYSSIHPFINEYIHPAKIQVCRKSDQQISAEETLFNFIINSFNHISIRLFIHTFIDSNQNSDSVVKRPAPVCWGDHVQLHHSFSYPSIHPFIHSSFHPYIHLLIHWFQLKFRFCRKSDQHLSAEKTMFNFIINSVIHPFNRLFIHPFIQSIIHPFSKSFIH